MHLGSDGKLREQTVQNGNELVNFMLTEKQLNTTNRPIRLKLFHQKKQTDDILLPQFVSGTESVCGGFEYQVDCVATSYSLPLK
jgi:type VI secretion system secreted protein VgrG